MLIDITIKFALVSVFKKRVNKKSLPFACAAYPAKQGVLPLQGGRVSSLIVMEKRKMELSGARNDDDEAET